MSWQYKVGQTVYVAEYAYDYGYDAGIDKSGFRWQALEYYVDSIKHTKQYFKKVIKEKLNYICCKSDEEGYCPFNEQDLFETKEKAQERADRNNKEDNNV